MSESSTEKTPPKAVNTKSGVAADTKSSDAELQSVKGTEPDGTVIKVDGTVSSGSYDEQDAQVFVTLKEDLFEEFYFPDTLRPSYRLLFHAGQVVPKATVDAYNEATEKANARRENGGVDPENPAGIDSTTLASGTKVATDA